MNQANPGMGNNGVGNNGGGVQLGVSPVAPTPAPPAIPSAAPSAKAGAAAGSATPAPGTTPLKKTQERLAADAWTEGNFELASRLYGELSTQHPENPAFREAARICHEKMSTH